MINWSCTTFDNNSFNGRTIDTFRLDSKVKTNMNILAPTRYPWTFNGPKSSQHNISRKNFVPFNKIPQAKLASIFEGLTVFNANPFANNDLIHAFNRIPIFTNKPFIIGFESHLPRMYGYESSILYKLTSRKLASNQCKAIVPFSEVAKKIFFASHSHFPWFHELEAKTQVRLPNIIVPPNVDAFDHSQEKIKLVFVGSHFSRKGGCVAVKLAELAYLEGYPLEIHIVSSLKTNSWVDPLDQSFFIPYLKLIQKLPNIIMHGQLDNNAVLSLMSSAHFTLLPTLSDTFGFSVLEGMSVHTPAIATTQGALPEFLNSDNSIVLKLDCDEFGQWAAFDYDSRHLDSYVKTFKQVNEELSRNAYEQIKQIVGDKTKYLNMRKEAYKTVKEKFWSYCQK